MRPSPAGAGGGGLYGRGAFIASRLVLMSTRSGAHSEGMGHDGRRYMALLFEVLRGVGAMGEAGVFFGFVGIWSLAAARCRACARPSCCRAASCTPRAALSPCSFGS